MSLPPHPAPLAAVCFYHITMWYRMKLVQVFVCTISLELLFGCHHWLCHHFVTCLLDFVNFSWVSQITFIPVECACCVGVSTSPLRPPHKAITLDGVVLLEFSGFVRLIKSPPVGWRNEEDSTKSEEEALSLAIWLWDWLDEIKCLVTPLLTAFSLPSMVIELSSSWVFFFFLLFKKEKKLSNPRTLVPSICLHFIEWLSMCEKKMAETKRISKERPHS